MNRRDYEKQLSAHRSDPYWAKKAEQDRRAAPYIDAVMRARYRETEARMKAMRPAPPAERADIAEARAEARRRGGQHS